MLTTNITRSQSLWNSLITTYGEELIENHVALAALGRELDIRLNIKGLLAKLEGSFNQNDPTSIVVAIQDADKALDIPENREFSNELTEMRERLVSRMALLIGQTHEQAGDGVRALEEYRKVSLDDKAEAEGRIKQIETQLKRDDEILKAIKKAEKNLQTKPIQAIEFIYPKRDELTTYREKLLSLLESARYKIEERLENSFKAHENKSFADGDIPQIESELSWVESLGSTNTLLLRHIKGKLAESYAKKHESLGGMG